MSDGQADASTPPNSDRDAAADQDDNSGEMDAAPPADGSVPRDAAPDASDPPRTGKSAGCGETSPKGALAKTMTIGDKERSYLLVVPGSYNINTPLPIVLAFHGSGGSGPQARQQFDLEGQADGQAIFVYPTALPDPTQDNKNNWVVQPDSDDVAFADALVKFTEGHYCTDRARVFATGFSLGGRMTAALGCWRGDVLRAIAGVAPGYADKLLKNCVGRVALWEAVGSADEAPKIVTCENTRDFYLAANGCGTTTTAVPPAPCVRYNGCVDGLPVIWCKHDGAHIWPDFAPQGVWSFFASKK
jgi:polyhydroxybutyrate depolymerase